MILFVGGVPCLSAPEELGPEIPTQFPREGENCRDQGSWTSRNVYVMCAQAFPAYYLYTLFHSTEARGTQDQRT